MNGVENSRLALQILYTGDIVELNNCKFENVNQKSGAHFFFVTVENVSFHVMNCKGIKGSLYAGAETTTFLFLNNVFDGVTLPGKDCTKQIYNNINNGTFYATGFTA